MLQFQFRIWLLWQRTAKSIINFDEEFMGELKVNEALLVHIGIPVKGLISDSVFLFNDISGNFENVRITNI